MAFVLIVGIGLVFTKSEEEHMNKDTETDSLK